MNSTELWNRYCEWHRYYEPVGLAIDVSRMKFTKDFITQLTPKMTAAFKAMDELEKGAIANPDEKRMVGHYWLRAPEMSPTSEIKDTILATNKKIAEFAKGVRSGTIKSPSGKKFTRTLLVGIGGSALGPQLLADALWHADAGMELLFSDNTDPDGIARTLRMLQGKLDETLVVVISKSGGTPEPRNGQLEAAKAYEKAGLQFAKHAVAITCKGSKLDQTAASEGWLTSIEMWDWVGGRTSLFSAVGLVPAALLGISTEEFLDGARAMDVVTRNKNITENPAALLALMWFYAGNGKGAKDMVVLPYKDRLVLFSKYLQQLVMESLGKEFDLNGEPVNQGIAVYGNKGSTDQHAYVQQLREGVPNFFATFIEVLNDSSNGIQSSTLEIRPNITCGDYLLGFLLGTRGALYEKGRESITLTINELSARSLAGLIALYERAVGFYATLVNINAYHQPGVEAGKKGAEEIIVTQEKLNAYLSANPGKKTATELATAMNTVAQTENIYHMLEHLAANGRVTREGARNPLQAKFGS